MLSSAVTRARAARKNESGFTLIELLIVIVILGILAGIVVFSVAGITDRGDKSACKATVASVEVAVEAFYAQANPPAYPQATADIVPGFLKTDPGTDYITYNAGAAPTIKDIADC
ncbi:MAG: type II secretion system protein [Propionibacteriales bacterium]|nr:type II secretion system protein [Propionibacteriales bacterium]